MAAITTLPILEAVRSIVEVAFTLVFSRFFTFGIQFDRRHFVRIDIHDVQDIGKVSRDNQLVTVQDHIARTVPLQRDTFAEAIQESQVVVQHRLIGIVQEFLQHRLMVNHADLVRSRMRDENRLVVAGNAPDTGRPPFGFIHDDGSQELLLVDIDHAESTRVHPSLLQLRCRDGETPQVVGYIYIFAVGSYTDSPKGIASVCQLDVLHLREAIHFDDGYTGGHIIEVSPLCRKEVRDEHIFAVLAEHGGLRFAQYLHRTHHLPRNRIDFGNRGLELVTYIYMLLVRTEHRMTCSRTGRNRSLHPARFEREDL